MKGWILRFAVFLILIATLGQGYLPVKKAVKQENIDTSRSYILVKVQKSTVSPWIAVGDNDGYYEIRRNTYLTGVEPQGFNYGIDFGDNTFICYGQYSGIREFASGEHYAFNVESWDILYPVMREGSLFKAIQPRTYICRFDMN